MRATWTGFACLLGLPGPAAIADADGTGVGLYDGHRLVRVQVENEDQLRTMRDISDDCWCEVMGVGTLDFRVDPVGLARLSAAGMEFDVLIDDIQVLVDAEKARLAAAAQADGAGGSWFTEFKDLAAIESRLQSTVALHPGLAELIDIGDSIEGRDIWAIKLSGDGVGKPAVLFNSCQHAREWVSPMVTMYIIDALVGAYGLDPEVTALLDAIEVYVVPVVNPDGYVHSWPNGGDVRLWRKNRRENADGTFGVDPNRNWAVGWGGPGGSSGNPGDPDYRGTGPFSEPETQALSGFYIEHPNIVASIDFHAYGELILYPYGYQAGGPDDDGQHATLGQAMAEAILDVNGVGYQPGPLLETLYEATGGSIDWTWGDRGVVSYTIELRPSSANPGFILPPEQIIPTAEENLPAALRLARAVADGVLWSYPAGRPDLIEAGTTSALAFEARPFASGPLDPAAATLYWRANAGDAFSVTPAMHLGGDAYEAALPAVACGATLEYYLAIDSLAGSTYTEPTDAPTSVYSALAQQITVAFADDFESDQGWTIENVDLADGGWERGVPAGGGDRGDPPVDADGSGACYVTDNEAGNSDVDGGPTRVTSPLLDLSAMSAPRLAWAAWFTNDDGDGDRLDVEITATGGDPWTLVASHGATAGWERYDVAVADFVAPTSTVRVRFSATDNPNDSVTEAGVDAVRIFDAGCPSSSADVDGNGVVDFQDLLLVLAAWGPCPDCAEDIDGNGAVDFQDLLELLSSWS